jgi:hypothetical protein
VFQVLRHGYLFGQHMKTINKLEEEDDGRHTKLLNLSVTT